MPRSETRASQIRRPTLRSSCSQAATAQESRYRLAYPRATQASRIIALDEGGVPIVCRLAEEEWWGDSHLLQFEGLTRDENGAPVDATLLTCAGAESRLSAELQEADVVVMIATSDDAAEAASLIGDACAERRIMTTGLVFAEPGEVDATVANLRPNAMVMLISDDQDDLVSILTALRV